MHLDGFIVLGSAVVGFLVGMTGAGGGVLMTPMLIFVFGVSPTAAISSDLVATIFMRPVGAAVHLRRGTVDLRVVGWLAAGSIPSAFLGAYLLRLVGTGKAARTDVQIVLGVALLLGAAAMLVRSLMRRPPGGGPSRAVLAGRTASNACTPRLATVAVGVVGLKYVGAGIVGPWTALVIAAGVAAWTLYDRSRARRGAKAVAEPVED